MRVSLLFRLSLLSSLTVLMACDADPCPGGASESYSLALVPGTSEEWGHHKAPPLAVEAKGVRISREFSARLNKARELLEMNAISHVLVSGGAIDEERPDYNEAERGREYLLAKGVSDDRILLDRLAEHTTTNVRNAAKLAVDMGLDRMLIVTTMPEAATLSPADVATQGYYLLYHPISTFDAQSMAQVGYQLGSFRRVLVSRSVVAIEHCGFPAERLAADSFGP